MNALIGSTEKGTMSFLCYTCPKCIHTLIVLMRIRQTHPKVSDLLQSNWPGLFKSVKEGHERQKRLRNCHRYERAGEDTETQGHKGSWTKMGTLMKNPVKSKEGLWFS